MIIILSTVVMGRSGSVISAPTAVMVAAYKLKNASNWWDQIDESPLWQDRLYHILAALFGIVSFVAVVTFFFFFLISPLNFRLEFGNYVKLIKYYYYVV